MKTFKLYRGYLGGVYVKEMIAWEQMADYTAHAFRTGDVAALTRAKAQFLADGTRTHDTSAVLVEELIREVERKK